MKDAELLNTSDIIKTKNKVLLVKWDESDTRREIRLKWQQKVIFNELKCEQYDHIARIEEEAVKTWEIISKY